MRTTSLDAGISLQLSDVRLESVTRLAIEMLASLIDAVLGFPLFEVTLHVHA